MINKIRLKINRAYRYRLYPTPDQEKSLRQQCGNCRFLWNKFLDLNQQTYEATGKFVFGHALITSIPKLKKQYDFLGLTFSQSLQLNEFSNWDAERLEQVAKLIKQNNKCTNEIGISPWVSN